MRRQAAVWMLALFVVLGLATPAAAAGGWVVAVLEASVDPVSGVPQHGDLVFINQTGETTRTSIPDAATAALLLGDNVRLDVLLSPDLSKAVVFTDPYENQSGAPPLAIMDLLAESCCVYVELPPGTEGVDFGTFNDDATAFAMSYVTTQTGDPNQYATGALWTVDVTSGAITRELPYESLPEMGLAEGAPAMVFVGSWRGSGITFVPSCWGCEPTVDAPYVMWNTLDNTLGFMFNNYYSIFGDRLDATGEYLYTAQNMLWSFNPDGAYFPPANVVEYYAGGAPQLPYWQRYETAQYTPVVFHNPNMLNLNVARWIQDGEGYLVTDQMTGEGLVVMRSGYRVDAKMTGRTFLAGTPEGWLAYDALNVVWHNRYDAPSNSVVSEQRAQLTMPPQLVYAPPLGATASAAGFSPLPPPEAFGVPSGAGVGLTPTPVQLQPAATSAPAQAAAVTCPGTLPSRLVAGGQGRVTPGTPNNLRDFPSLEGQRIGQIPGGEAFAVLGGPTCDPNGRAWWQVQYNGVVGWTVEVDGSAYYVEPLS